MSRLQKRDLHRESARLQRRDGLHHGGTTGHEVLNNLARHSAERLRELAALEIELSARELARQRWPGWKAPSMAFLVP